MFTLGFRYFVSTQWSLLKVNNEQAEQGFVHQDQQSSLSCRGYLRFISVVTLTTFP